MLDSRAQCPQIGPCRKIGWIDEKRRMQIGRRDFNAPTALRPQESQPYRKALIGLDFGRPYRGSGEQRVHIGTIGFLQAAKEKMAPGSGSRRHRRLRLGDEAHDEAMVLQVLANTGQVADNGNAVTAQLLSTADP
jgi:hypothetical protein